MNPKGRNDYLSEANRLLCNSDADYYTLLKDAEEKLYEMVDAKINAYEDSDAIDDLETKDVIDIYKLVNIL